MLQLRHLGASTSISALLHWYLGITILYTTVFVYVCVCVLGRRLGAGSLGKFLYDAVITIFLGVLASLGVLW